MKIPVISAKAAEEADRLVCVPWTEHHYPDDIKATCCACGCDVAHRPHAPAAPIKICVPCFEKAAETNDAITIATTSESAKELAREGWKVDWRH